MMICSYLCQYKMNLIEEMKECDWKIEVLLENVVPDNAVLSSDEAHFHLSSYVNKHNFHCWADSNPCQKHERYCIAHMLLFGGLYHIWM